VNDQTEKQASGVDILLVFDLSWSMMALDMGGPGERVTPGHLLPRFDPQELPREPWVVRPADLQPG
jgi:hypothetical protein